MKIKIADNFMQLFNAADDTCSAKLVELALTFAVHDFELHGLVTLTFKDQSTLTLTLATINSSLKKIG